jgi:nicotinamidase-related amidase
MRRALSCLVLTTLAAASLAVASEGPSSDAPAGKPALVVMDIQNAYLPMMDDEGKEQALQRVNWAVAMFRQRGLPIIVVSHSAPDFGASPGSEGFAFVDGIKIGDDDIRLTKTFPSAFKETELEELLKEQGCDTVFLVGLSAVGCVLHTYFDAAHLDFRTFMIEGALLSHDAELTDSVERIVGAVDFGALEYMLLNAPR